MIFPLSNGTNFGPFTKSLYRELDHNNDILYFWEHNPVDDLACGTVGVKLRDETWRAFSEGGELEWIKSTLMLSLLSNAYRRIRMVQVLSERHYNLINFRKERAGITILEEYIKLLKESVTKAKHSISVATSMIDEDLNGKMKTEN